MNNTLEAYNKVETAWYKRKNTHTHEGEVRKKKQKGIIIHVCFTTASNDEDEQPSVIDRN